MDFDFVDGSSDLHGVRMVAVTLREEANAREPERKRLMKEARLAGDDETHELIECNAAFQNVSIFFPSVSAYQGVCFSIKKMDAANWCYLSSIGAEGFDSLSTIEITEQFQAARVCGGTTEWGLR